MCDLTGMKRLLYLTALLMIFCFGCKKDKHDGPGDGSSVLKIQLISGSNQKDTVGNLLKDSIIVKVTENGLPAGNYAVQFKRSGCEDVSITQKTTGDNGLVSYAWYLSGETGGQLLRAILTDNNGNKKDSVMINATGITAAHGWHRSGCVQNFPVNNVSALSSGRLLSAVNKAGYPYYSDDNAVSWHPLKSFPGNQLITKIMPGAPNEAFIATQQGLFYSSNNGQSWTSISSSIADPTNFADFTYTKNGTLIFSDNSGAYLSDDKGATWIDASFGLPDGMSYYPCEAPNGDLYIVGSDAELYKSINGGNTWVNQGSSVGNTLLSSIESLFIDDNGDMYIGTPHNGPGAPGGVYRSANHGTTWKNLFTLPPIGTSYANITQINKLGGNYYFSFAGRGVYQTANFSVFGNITTRFSSYGLLSYTVANNATFVIGSPGYGIFYYVP